jgi:hypothetical protein
MNKPWWSSGNWTQRIRAPRASTSGGQENSRLLGRFDSKDRLFGAILIDLGLEELDLHDVKVTKANLIDLWLKGVDLSQALNLTPDQI